MILVAIDPGYKQSAMVRFDSDNRHEPVRLAIILSNADLRLWLQSHYKFYDQCVCEMLTCFGMPVGKEVLDTCREIGRFQQIVGDDRFAMVTRTEEKQCLCHSQKANDVTIRQALIDRFGPGKQKAIGRKKSPGPLYGLKCDLWSALAVALTYLDRSQAKMTTSPTRI
jgi:hypothetical protein